VRTFIALNFASEVHDTLHEMNEYLQTQAASGKFVPRENYHLTLVFLGDIDPAHVEDIRKVLEQLPAGTIPLTFEKLGTFNPSRKGRIYWVGIESNPQLKRLHETLLDKLETAGFDFDRKPFRPHVTLGRKVVTSLEAHRKVMEAFEPFNTIVDSLSLMKSERIGDRMVYEPVITKKL